MTTPPRKASKILYIWEKFRLLKLMVFNGRQNNDIIKEDVLRKGFKQKGRKEINHENDTAFNRDRGPDRTDGARG
jgi:hypothetical protein